MSDYPQIVQDALNRIMAARPICPCHGQLMEPMREWDAGPNRFPASAYYTITIVWQCAIDNRRP